MSEPKFQVGDVVRHRLSGELAVVIWYDATQTEGYNSLGCDFGRSWVGFSDKNANLVFDVVGHITDARWDATPKGINAGRNDSRMVGNVIACPPDPALPRRFRWKYETKGGFASAGLGVCWPQTKTTARYTFGPGGYYPYIPDGYTITEWIDPKPEGVA